MRKLEDTLKARELSDTTIKAYMMRLRHLNNFKAFNSFAFLKDIPAIDKIIEEGTENTRKNHYAAILSCMKDYRTKSTYRKAYEYYERKFKTSSDTIKAELKTNEKTETQKENWIEWKEVIEVRDKLQAEVDAIDLSGSILQTDYNKILSNLILALYTYIPPRRNKDYMKMYVAYFPHTLLLPKDKNYYDIKNQRFIFNTYKTETEYGQQIVDITGKTELIKALSDYLKVHQTKIPVEADHYMFPLLTHYGGGEFKLDYDITRNLNRTFGKNIGATMLRHIYLSNEYGSTIEKRKEDAKNMGHSLSTQIDYIKI